MSKDAKEKNLEADIESYLVGHEGGYRKGTDAGYKANPGVGVDIDQLTGFIADTQPKAWKIFCGRQKGDPAKAFLKVFRDAVRNRGILEVLKRGIRHRGLDFKVCYFMPESRLNQGDLARYEANRCRVIRQFHYSATEAANTVDMVLDVNGIPVVAIELKDQFTGQTVDDAKLQWMSDRDPREECFRFDSRVIAFFAVDLSEAWMTTELKGMGTRFLPFNQGSNGAGVDGDVGNPPNPDGYETSYLWEDVLRRDSLLDIIHRYVHVEEKETTEAVRGVERKRKSRHIIFPRFHQLDVVRKVCADVKAHGPGCSFLVQHSAGSGKSNSIAWCAYQLSTMFDADDEPIFDSVVVVTDRTVLDRQIQETIGGMARTRGQVTVIDDKCTSKDLKEALNDGKRLIVSTLQKYSVIYDEVESEGKRFAVIVDEAHSSQTGSHAVHLKQALADPEGALREFEDFEEMWEDEDEATRDRLLAEMAAHGSHDNLTFVAFTATPKKQTLELFGVPCPDGSYVPYHVYSMRQAIGEGFIMDPLSNYVTYREALEIVRKVEENPDVPTSPTMKLLRKYKELHPYALTQKAKIIVETYRQTTRKAIRGHGKMMVVTASRLACVRYYHTIKDYMASQGYDDMEVLVAFSDSIRDPADGPDGPEYTEPMLNTEYDGRHLKESQTKTYFHKRGSVLVVAEKYQTGFDEPLLHTLVIDKKLKDVKAVQTICRIDRTHPDKVDTLVIDFVNTREQILNAFEPYYTSTELAEAIDTDRIYQVLDEIHGYEVYTEDEVDAAAALEFGKDRRSVQGRIKSVLTPAVRRYEALSQDERYQFRRKVRSFCKWYSYVTQIVRMFDRHTHKEYVYLSYLRHLLADDNITVEAIDDKVRMDYYKLEETYNGAITLEATTGMLKQDSGRTDSALDRRTEPLDVLVRRINEQYPGDFTDADRVVTEIIFRSVVDDQRVRDSIAHDGKTIFTNSIWPKMFEEKAMDAYMANTEAFTSMFEDREKYEAIMKSIGEMLVSGHVG